MLTYMLQKWLEINNFIKTDPMLYGLIFFLALIVYHGIPWGYRTITGRMRKDRQERDTTRDNIKAIKAVSEHNSDLIQDIVLQVKTQNGNVARIKENVLNHCTDTTIHHLEDKFVTKKEYDPNHALLIEGQKQIVEAVTGVHRRIDDLYKRNGGAAK